jgi:co-chaperonin GroES (HSP10)
MEISIKPKFSRVLIKREVKEKTSGGIILPDNAAKRHANCEGVIVALGETAGWTQAYDENGESVNKQIFKVGDIVLFGRHAGAWLDATYGKTGEAMDDGTLFICQDEDILAIKE